MENNKEDYTKALTKMNNNANDDEKLEVSISSGISAKLKKIKKYMEWSTDITINSAITYIYKKNLNETRDNLFDIENEENNSKKIESNDLEKINFTATVKNENRVAKLKDPLLINPIVTQGISELYKKIIEEHEKNE